MAVPTWTVGEVLAAADVNAWFVPVEAYKTADLSRATNATPSNDPDLQLPVAANAVYSVTYYIPNSGAAPGTVDLKSVFTAPAGATFVSHAVFNQTSGVGIGLSNTIGLSAVVSGTQVAPTAIIGEGTLTTAGTAGSFIYQWSQNVSSATATVVKAGARIMLQRIG